MITYKSTRGKDINTYSFSEAILQGIATDGGLLVPSEIPHISRIDMQELSEKSYQEKALHVMQLFQTDISIQTMKRIVNEAYSKQFDDQGIAPLVHLKQSQYMLELWHGPTAAFKDMALQIMPLFFAHAAEQENKQRTAKGQPKQHYLILVATSGDTGKAALEGYKDKKNISIIVFYPHNRVSALQKLQMATQEGKNVAVYAAEGDFDAVQTAVKQVFTDRAFNHKLLQNHAITLSSANSINWGRLLPQTIYYISAYADLVKNQTIVSGEPIDVVVPTGNFGNILAAFIAKKMGLPLRMLICASNTNNVLTDFLQTGSYDISSRTLVSTPSPSMDILIASNVERLLYFVTDSHEKVAGWMDDLQKHKRFVIDADTKQRIQETFIADWVSNDASLATIKAVYDEQKYLMDPHTAVAQKVGERYLKKTKSDVPLVICSTAHWSKFVKDVYPLFAENKSDILSDEFAMLDFVSSTTGDKVPQNISTLQKKALRFTDVCPAGKEAVEEIIIRSLTNT